MLTHSWHARKYYTQVHNAKTNKKQAVFIEKDKQYLFKFAKKNLEQSSLIVVTVGHLIPADFECTESRMD